MSAVFTCSIDDGHPSDMKAAELLARHGLRATFYVPIRNCEGPPVLSGSDLWKIATEFEIGSHTLDHRFLRDLPPAVARRQVFQGKKILEDRLGRRIAGFCYPGGKFRAEHAGLVADAGFRYARTITNMRFDAGDDAFRMPTTIQFIPHHVGIYLRNYARGDWMRRRAGFAIAFSHRDWVDRLYALFAHAVRTGGVFHLWAHSKDIDEFDIWHQFDRFLAHVAAHVAIEDRLDNGQLVARMLPAAGEAETGQYASLPRSVK